MEIVLFTPEVVMNKTNKMLKVTKKVGEKHQLRFKEIRIFSLKKRQLKTVQIKLMLWKRANVVEVLPMFYAFLHILCDIYINIYDKYPQLL